MELQPKGNKKTNNNNNNIENMNNNNNSNINNKIDGQSSGGDKVIVACVQMQSEFGEVEKNTNRAIALCEEAAANGAKIIVLPELAIHSFFSQDMKHTWEFTSDNSESSKTDPSSVAELIPEGKTIQTFSSLSKRLQVYIAVPILEIDRKGLLYDSVVLVSPEGSLVAHYRKQNLWRQKWCDAGNKIECYDTPYGRIGFAIGNDINEAFQAANYGKGNLWALLWSNAWVTGYGAENKEEAALDFFQKTLPNHLQNQCAHYLLNANWSVSSAPENWRGYGYSGVYGNNGKILCCAHEELGDEIVYCTLRSKAPYRAVITSSVSPKTVKVACIQVSSDLGQIDKNSEKIEKLCTEAAQNGAKILVLPETAITGYLSQDLKTNWYVDGKPIERSYSFKKSPEGFAQKVPGPITERFAKLSKQLGVYITVPLLEYDVVEETGKKLYYNTVCLVSPKGELVAHYRKNNPWPYPEKSWATAGKELATYNTEYGKVGLTICFDVHTILDRYDNENIWSLLYPIAWVGGPMVSWFHGELPNHMISRHDFNVIGCNWSVDHWQEWYDYGYSTIYAKGGSIVATAKSVYGSEIIYGELPIDKQ